MKTSTKAFVWLIIVLMVGLVVYMKYFYDPDVSDPDKYAAFIKSFDVSDYGEPDFVGTGAQSQFEVPASRHAYYGLDFSHDILKGDKSVEYKLQWFDLSGCGREHYRIRNLDTGLYDIRMDRIYKGGGGGRYTHICSYTFQHDFEMPYYIGGAVDPRSFKDLHGAYVKRYRSNHLYIIRHWDGSDKIVLYDLVDQVPVGYFYDIKVDPELTDSLFDKEEVYSEYEI